MNVLAERTEQCPYCGESIDLLIDPSGMQQNYIEDCQVCCQPIIIDVTVTHEGEISLFLLQENE
ncbi:MAG TPA: CPXCG motif-containing cysteine-rich protein [Methyloprofundus sp.]|uniref:CPXCG motif-containing cysteine-rich protein n=1 Tax=Methyloprofundus sp. TaxID=2020875 RepID=UPI0017BD3F10|nr:CPXCG motif-containing cysteine-rich protein [Methyloprofundus sp.]HIG65831.1 CPXCG motif-containing cysteine-rich protein [Methyloprofundus sp.]HIL79455.1 CPXCG motif-containing cysteine-rich protein [Methylococcales bacterium]